MLFIDLTKAFDTVSQPGLWSILAKLGCPPDFIRMVCSFHDGMMARVIHDGVVSEPFPITNGVKQAKTSFEKNCFSAWASTLNMGLINKIDMVCLSPVGYGV